MRAPQRSTRPIPLIFAGAILATVAFLSEGGPFFDRWAKDDASRVTSLYLAGDDRIFTGAGSHDRDRAEYRAQGVEGALVFGPYVTLEPGRYTVRWIGRAGQPSRPRFEVASMKDGVIAAHTRPLPASGSNAVLHSIDLKVARPIEGAEFRVIVGRGDALSVHAIELVALTGAPRQP